MTRPDELLFRALVVLVTFLLALCIFGTYRPPQPTHSWQRPCPTDEGELIAHPEEGSVCRRPEGEA